MRNHHPYSIRTTTITSLAQQEQSTGRQRGSDSHHLRGNSSASAFRCYRCRLDHHELQNPHHIMVVGSSLRRQNATRAPHPTIHKDEHESEHLSLRSKRLRAASLKESPELHKRRKVLNNGHPQKLRIPLRGRTGLPKTEPAPAGELPTPATSVDSPTPKAQYDQFRRVEEKARASIRDNKSDNTAQDDRRKLRSEHGGSRSKTELAQYFPNFEEMLSLESPDPSR